MHRIEEKCNHVRPYFIEVLGEEGLTAHDIARALDLKISHVHQRIIDEQWLTKNPSVFRFAEFSANVDIGQGRKREIKTFAFSTIAAKAFVARTRNDKGDAYLEFLLECERVVLEELPRLKNEYEKMATKIKNLQLLVGKPPRRDKGNPTMMVSVERPTLFGTETIQRRVPVSGLSRVEYLMNMYMNIEKQIGGMQRKKAEIQQELAGNVVKKERTKRNSKKLKLVRV